MTPSSENRRILIIDDNLAIHDDFRKILSTPTGNTSLLEAGAILFGTQSDTLPSIPFELSCANQGQTGLGMVQEAIEQERPFAVAFVDMRMPSGWDGVETIERIWEVDSDLQIVICTAISDHSWDQVLLRLPYPEKLLVLRKPFDRIEVWQLANSLTQRWNTSTQAKHEFEELAALQEERELEMQDVVRQMSQTNGT